MQFCVGDLFVRVLTHGFKHGDDVELARVAGDAAGENRAAIDEHGRAVQPRDGDHCAGHVFVATADGDEAVHAFRAHDGFDGVGDDFARNERIFHAFRAHRNAVGHGDGIEDDGLAAGSIGTDLAFEREFINVHVARCDVAPSGGDADDGLLKILRREADGIEHGAGGRAVRAVNEDAGVRAEGVDS